MKKGYLSEGARNDPGKLSKFEADMLENGTDKMNKVPAQRTAEWLAQLRNERARQGWLDQRWRLNCPQ
jgi:hypothetical protein